MVPTNGELALLVILFTCLTVTFRFGLYLGDYYGYRRGYSQGYTDAGDDTSFGADERTYP